LAEALTGQLNASAAAELISVNGLGTAYDVLPFNRHINPNAEPGKLIAPISSTLRLKTITSGQSWNSVPHEAKA
jgi:hypothetical protein